MNMGYDYGDAKWIIEYRWWSIAKNPIVQAGVTVVRDGGRKVYPSDGGRGGEAHGKSYSDAKPSDGG